MRSNNLRAEVHERCASVLRLDVHLGVGACIECLGSTLVVKNDMVIIDVDQDGAFFSNK